MANIFPRWSNLLPLKIAFCLGTVGAGAVLAVNYYATPKAQVVGYQPNQPIPFSHNIHVNQLGLDCRYCHSFVDVAGHSNVPTGNTCWNCHQHVQKGSPKLVSLRASMGVDVDHNPILDVDGKQVKGKPIEWIRVHKAPDYVYFNHSAHVGRGISCQSCHGDVHKMDVVYQAEPHSMGWCLDCHRAPEEHLRPLEEVFNFSYGDSDVAKYNKGDSSVVTTKDLGLKLKETFNVHPKTSCATCHH